MVSCLGWVLCLAYLVPGIWLVLQQELDPAMAVKSPLFDRHIHVQPELSDEGAIVGHKGQRPGVTQTLHTWYMPDMRVCHMEYTDVHSHGASVQHAAPVDRGCW